MKKRASKNVGEMETNLEEEEIVGVIHAAIPRFYASPEIYDLFFTNKRLIGAIVLSRKAAIGYNLLSAAYGILGYYSAKRDIETYRKIFEGKTPEEILLLNSDNFEIHYKDISSVSLHKRFLARIHGAVIKFEVFRKGVPEKLKFSFTSKQFSDAKRFVHQILEDKLK